MDTTFQDVYEARRNFESARKNYHETCEDYLLERGWEFDPESELWTPPPGLRLTGRYTQTNAAQKHYELERQSNTTRQPSVEDRIGERLTEFRDTLRDNQQ